MDNKSSFLTATLGAIVGAITTIVTIFSSFTIPPVPDSNVANQATVEQPVASQQTNVQPNNLKQVINVKPYYLLAVQNDGKYQLKTGGTIAWRFNNPGKIANGDFSRSYGSLGSDGKTAIFNSYQSGRKALYVLLFNNTTYQDLTIEQGFNKFAQETDGYNPTRYGQRIAEAISMPTSTLIGKIPREKRELVLDQIEKLEQSLVGKVTIFEDQNDYKVRGW